MPRGFSEKYFYVFTIKVNAKHVSPGVGPFLAIESFEPSLIEQTW